MLKVFILTYWIECAGQLTMKKIYPVKDCQKTSSNLFYKYEKHRFCELKAVSCKTLRNYRKDKAYFEQFNKD